MHSAFAAAVSLHTAWLEAVLYTLATYVYAVQMNQGRHRLPSNINYLPHDVLSRQQLPTDAENMCHFLQGSCKILVADQKHKQHTHGPKIAMDKLLH